MTTSSVFPLSPRRNPLSHTSMIILSHTSDLPLTPLILLPPRLSSLFGLKLRFPLARCPAFDRSASELRWRTLTLLHPVLPSLSTPMTFHQKTRVHQPHLPSLPSDIPPRATMTARHPHRQAHRPTFLRPLRTRYRHLQPAITRPLHFNRCVSFLPRTQTHLNRQEAGAERPQMKGARCLRSRRKWART
jgi:hypothetical protein